MTTPPYVRYKRLLQMYEKAMTHARSQMNVHEVLRDCYGDDLDMFDESGLQTLLGDMLDRVKEEVLEGMKESLEERKVEELLEKVERIVQQLDQKEACQQQAEAWDKESAHRALQKAVLPKGSEPGDLITYAAYQKMKSERDVMLAEIAEMDRETESLQAQREELVPQVQERIDQLQQVAKHLEKSADMCSMIS
jgi:ubiquinone biosynthesis protein COQ9